MQTAPFHPLYSTIVDLALLTGSEHQTVLGGVRTAWEKWVGSSLRRRASQHQFATRTEQSIDFDPNRQGKQIPLDGCSVEQEWWEADIGAGGTAIGTFVIRELQAGGRFWRTELALADQGGKATVTLRMGVESTEFRIQPLGWRVRAPGLWRYLTTSFEFAVQGRQIRHGQFTQHKGGDVAPLVRDLTVPNRQLPLVLVAVCSRTGGPPLDPSLPEKLGQELFALADVHYLSDTQTTWALSDAIGDEHGCYNGGVRIYWPGFDPRRAPDFRGLLVPERIAAMASLASEGLTRVLEATLRKIAPVSAFRFFPPPIFAELAKHRREHEGAQERNRLRSELSRSVNDDAMKLIDEAMAAKDKEIETLKSDYSREISRIHSEYSRQLEATIESGEPEDVEEGCELIVEFYRNSNGRRPVLDFSEAEFSKNKEARLHYLQSLTLFTKRWTENPKKFEKAKSVSVATKNGRRGDIWEYRAIEAQGAWVRVLFGLVEGNLAVLLHAISKRQNRLDDVDLETAKHRLQEYLER